MMSATSKNRNTNVLLISSNSSSRGGGERYLVYLAEGLRAQNIDVHVLLSDAAYMDTWVGDFTKLGCFVHRKPLIGLRDRRWRFLQSMCDRSQRESIRKFCSELNTDGILVNQQYDEDGLDYLAGALQSKSRRVVGLLHMPMTATKSQRPFGRLRGLILKAWYRRNPYQLILVSEGSRIEWESYYETPIKPIVVNYGCPFRSQEMPPPTLPTNWSLSIPTIGFVGQFVEQKNLLLLIDAWEQLNLQGTQSQLLLVGDGAQRKILEARLQASKVRAMHHITGWVDAPERYLSLIDLYCMTSHFEGLPLALIEAVGKGLPAVVTDFNGARDVASRASWVTVAARWSTDCVVESIKECISELPDRKLQASRGASAFREYFSIERMTNETLVALGLEKPT
jgi:glycosyltransferase involved in cell wall biosynthesis